MVGICTINGNNIAVNELAPSCGLSLPVAQDRACGNQLLDHAAAGDCAGKFQKLVELYRVCVYFDVCQCVLTGVTT